ncbi:UvrD-helicase domain-containing protein [Kitasatospora sp. NPDC059646]|uniref:UvrD-helicase domain-containing protein n=1 Tax=Kitasatospora sp. NPDC059646 TaxID=3346893 RepID=UPI00368126C8
MVDPTPEQLAVVDAHQRGQHLVVQAGAGCGKSSTLRLLGAADRRRMLYVAYNKAIATDAAASFPRTVSCSTAHSLAFRAVGTQYAHRLRGPRQTAFDAARILDVPRLLDISGPAAIVNDLGDQTAMPTPKIMRIALETVTRWCYSADFEIAARHLPRRPGLQKPETLAQLGALVLPVARAAWRDLLRTNGLLKFQHDHYLKMWQLGRPRLRADVVLLDEAQDTNDVVADVLLHQDHAQRIAVGDSAQQIYEWRGANDALAQFEQRLGAEQLTLSRSFRFGPAIAEAANAWLYIVGAPIRLTGHDPIPSRVGRVKDPQAVLCRTNAGAMTVVMDYLAAGRRVALVGGGDEMQRLARAAEQLLAGQPTDHPELSAFSTWQQVREYAEDEADGADLRVLVKLIDEHGPRAIQAATASLTGEDQADITVSTAHRSKGREWDRVLIHDDFRPPSPDPVTKLVTVRREEARLAYVAVTRARLDLDATALEWVCDVRAVAA